ncbi:hypothetical protein, partial [Alkalibacterium kapii]|uniref:hypothetical protein n=1 Tax=Alkalibacterium kapii TaxID=426704 RepID=UPI001C99BF06
NDAAQFYQLKFATFGSFRWRCLVLPAEVCYLRLIQMTLLSFTSRSLTLLTYSSVAIFLNQLKPTTRI